MSTIYIVSKIFTYLVLSPTIFIVLFFISSFYVKRFKVIFISIAFSFYLLSISAVSTYMLSPLESPYNTALQKDNRVNAVVVLSGGSVKGSANIPIGSDAYKRAMWGLMIAKSQNLPLLFSGAGIGEYTEADAFLEGMDEIRENLHVELPLAPTLKLGSFALHVENKSLDTYQNAKFSQKKFRDIGIDKPVIYLVTSAFHMKRSILLYEHFGFEVIPAATSFRLDDKSKELDFLSFVPKFSSLSNSYTALHEYAGIFSLVLRGIIKF